MPLKYTKDPKLVIKKLRSMIEDIPRIAGIEAERFFKDSFRKQGWEGNTFAAWKARGGARTRTLGEKQAGRSILIKSGALRRSIKVTRRGRNFVIVSSSLPYAQIHNEGGKISGNFTVRTHERRNRKGTGSHAVESHSRKVNTTIPKRQFLGSSSSLNHNIGRAIRLRLKKLT